MRFPAPTCNAENSLVETSNSSSSNPPWSPLQNSWVTNGDSETTCYDQVRHFFAAKFQSNAFTAIWGKEYFVICFDCQILPLLLLFTCQISPQFPMFTAKARSLYTF